MRYSLAIEPFRCGIIDEMQRTLDLVAVGIDFGTTNSSVALVTGGAGSELASFTFRGAPTESYRSVLYFEQLKSASGLKRTHGLTGLLRSSTISKADEKGRLIQSLKSHLSSRSLTGTEIFGRRHKLEEVISRLLTDLRKAAEHSLGSRIATPRWDGRCVSSGRSRLKTTNLLWSGCGMHSRLGASSTSSSRWNRSRPPIRMSRRWITMS